MTFIAGIDPGTQGAIAIYDTDTRDLVCMWDMPSWSQTVSKKQRTRVDPIGLSEVIDELKMYGVSLVIMEAVGGRPRQSASAGFVFGYTVGLTYMALVLAKLPLETVPPQHWKKILKVTGGKDAKDDDILNRAYEMFPNNRTMFISYEKSDRGKKRVDRAEAAMLAKFGGDHVWRTLKDARVKDTELKLAYRNADLGDAA